MSLKYRSYTLRDFKEIPQISNLTEEQIFDIEVVGRIFPFKTNSYVVNELINWDNIPDDPIFVLNFPQKGMLRKHHYYEIAHLIRSGADSEAIRAAADRIRWQLDPHPAGQLEMNVPMLNGERFEGLQHKYRETVLFFPSQGQTCHAFCMFCFRWPQFVGISELRMSSRNAEHLVAYLREHEEVTDVLFTGGDPMVMKAEQLASYVDSILDADLPHVQTIRFGTKALSYWPYRFLTDKDSPQILDTFRRITDSGRHVALMANFNHPSELRTPAVQEAIKKIKETGAEIRTQSPILRHINADPYVWSSMWKKQVKLGMIPYYMFMVRDTGAQHYFGVPLVEAWEIYREALQRVSGVARTVRGPSMSAAPGKVLLNGVAEINGRKVMVLSMIQGRDPDWVQKPFFAEYNENALWLDELVPAFGGDKFFFEDKRAPARQMLFFG